MSQRRTKAAALRPYSERLKDWHKYAPMLTNELERLSNSYPVSQTIGGTLILLQTEKIPDVKNSDALILNLQMLKVFAGLKKNGNLEFLCVKVMKIL